MAREKVQLDAQTAKSIGRQLVERLEESGVDDRDLVHRRDFEKNWEAKKLLKAIVERIDELVPWRGEPKEDWVEAAAELRTWILTHMTDEGWKRLQAARRKAEHARRNRTAKHAERLVQIRTTSMGAYRLKEIADEYQVDRAELLDKLSDWLSYDTTGQAAMKRFAIEKRLQHRAKDATNK
jgi:hemerythrin